MISLIREFFDSIGELFSLRNLRWHALAIALSVLLILTGADWLFYVSTRIPLLNNIALLAGLGGFIVPIVFPVALLLFGALSRNQSMFRLGIRVSQAVILGLLLSFFYKSLTGRAHPVAFGIGIEDISREFRFGLLRGGVFWGWPSSHTAVAFAGAVALIRSVRHRPTQVLALLYALTVAAGAAIGFHWFSDVVAGAIFGTLVGFVVTRFVTIPS